MPRASLPIHSKTAGPEKIGAALNERWHEINRQAIETAKARLDAAFNSIAQPLIDAAYKEALSDQERISHDERRKLAVALRVRIGHPRHAEIKAHRVCAGIKRSWNIEVPF